MLPPFVPPSARVSSETFPLITEFVVDRVEHSFDSSFSLSENAAAGSVATLPSIDEYLFEADSPSHGDDEFVERMSRRPRGDYEATRSGGAMPESLPSIPASALKPDLMAAEPHTPPSGAEGAVVNEIVEPVDAWAASASGGAGDSDGANGATAAGEGPGAATTEAPSGEPWTPAPIAPEVWVAEERDAFDWHGVANLAVPPAEERRAAEEWSSTEWDRSSGSVQDHVAAVLAQVARRVRAGELEVQGSKQMGPEAVLVAVLSALLAEPGRR